MLMNSWPTAPNDPKFRLGRLVATPAALAAFERAGDPTACDVMVGRHVRGDWGDLCAEDKAQNDVGIAAGEAQDRLLSCYRLDNGERVYIITEWDRSVTTVLLPSDY